MSNVNKKNLKLKVGTDVSGFSCSIDNDQRFLEIIDILSHLKRSGIVTSPVIIGNDLPLIQEKIHFPWNLFNRNKPVPENIRTGHGKKYVARKWAFIGAIHGTAEQLNTTKKLLAKAVSPNKIKFIDGEVPKTESGKNISGARLSQHSILPATSEGVRHCLELLEPIYHKYGFDCPVAFTSINQDALSCVSRITFDPANKFEMSQAMLCHKELNEALIENGYVSVPSLNNSETDILR